VHPKDRFLVIPPNSPHSVRQLSSIPDYFNDLNAVHELEKLLKGGLRNTYDAWLGIIAEQEHCFIWETTAAQRAEAIGLTLGLWEARK